MSWDEELPPDIQKTWCQWISEVPRLSELHIPRYVLSSSAGEPTDILELHCLRCQPKGLWCFYIYKSRESLQRRSEPSSVKKPSCSPNQNSLAATRITRCIACRPTSKQSQSNSRSQKAL
ncbi:hypothetical protein AVEN_200732-1 [Araneus ventricosus]|uniref:Uncharacterized protein n=1 Tax=Araneus ventricosus TaxID=182803 RepID=A0A4Y2WEY6_ARAVE|nr:hypothetical protein AVEN_200732-1 [Araneus ventricosus]